MSSNTTKEVVKAGGAAAVGAGVGAVIGGGVGQVVGAAAGAVAAPLLDKVVDHLQKQHEEELKRSKMERHPMTRMYFC